MRAIVAQRWDEHNDQISPTFHLVDTRAGSSYEYDKAGQLEASKVFIDIGFVTGDSRRDIEAIRGESFVITRLTLVASNGSILEILYLVEVDEAGRLSRGVAFDPEDIDAAITELDEWYVASRSEGTWNPEFVSSMNVGDWDALRRLAHPDFAEADRWTQTLKVSNGPHVRLRPVSIERDAADGCVVRLRNAATGRDTYHAFRIRHGLIEGHEVSGDLANLP